MRCKSAKADHRQTAVANRAKGNPMKDNARQEPGSTRSLSTPLSRSATPARRFASPSKNPYKIRTKSDHFREREFFNRSSPSTYNFNALKCTDFLRRSMYPLPWGEGKGEGQTGSWLWRGRGCHFFSLGEGQDDGQTGYLALSARFLSM